MVCPARPRIHTQKKTIFARERDTERVRKKREAFLAIQQSLAARRLVFVDESGMRLGSPPRYGWAARGMKAYGKATHGPWKTVTMIGAMSLDGVRGFMTIDDATSTEVFDAFVSHELVPNLQPGDCVVMDNLPAHKVLSIRQRIEAAAASVIFLPPYSPELNPIEKLWAKLKEFVRRCTTETRDHFDAAVKDALNAISLADITAWTQHCGYSINEI